jgi:hypothetical protein
LYSEGAIPPLAIRVICLYILHQYINSHTSGDRFCDL